ncbi:MAG TPA: S8 family serine peptidase, partial [Blastocatellia bacterium]|nr:S8 family serine peptidase [Blastocatellia bacterium]
MLRTDASSSIANQSGSGLAGNRNLILLRRGVIDTEARVDLDSSSSDRAAHANSLQAITGPATKLTRIVQFAGPLKRKWIDALTATGAEIIGYVPNYAYIIRAAAPELARVAELDRGTDADETHPIRWMARLLPIQKIDPVHTDEMLNDGRGTSAEVEIELTNSPGAAASIETINKSALIVNRAPRRFGKFVVLSVTVDASRMLEIASLEDVLFIGPAFQPRLNDERSAQIAAGNLTADRTQPSGPGYLDWLASKGLTGQSDFVIDFTDSGLDRGSALPSKLHPDFLDAAQQSRVSYIFNYANDGRIDDLPGHGTLVASVAAGRGASNRKDEPGYMYGLGVDPDARLGVSRIFDENNHLASQLNYTNIAIAAYSAGARISNNSWGNISNGYDSTAQEFDFLVRDAQPNVPGNQEMVYVFAAANAGSGRVGSPATAKNVISVAASENYRPAGYDSCNIDGGSVIGPDGADNALDILRYSGGGPTADGRVKPDIAAPGTHIYGAASQTPGFFAAGLCPGVGVYQPPDQSPLYTWSSGTSLAAPHITGAASLVRRFFTSRNLLGDNRAPSPAMTKAYLIDAASYMTGENAGGNLPDLRQGWGLVNLSRAFDNKSRRLIDQTRVFTESGQTFEVHASLADRSLPFRATLAWTDAAGSLIGPALVNDLDLEISIAGAPVTVYRGNNFVGETSVANGEFDRSNNIESIYIPAGTIPISSSGDFTITVRAANIAGDGVPGNGISLDQDFALVLYNAGPPIIIDPPPPTEPYIINATYVKKRLTITGGNFTANAQVEINGKIIDQTFEFDSVAHTLSLKLKRRKL